MEDRDVGSLFNVGIRIPPPELIIQDELHLISGPLGTLAGLYETAIDFLCTRGRASAEGHRLDGDDPPCRAPDARPLRREMRQFPPPGIDARDSWFAVEARATRREPGCTSG